MSATIDEFEFFLEKPWSDGLPVVTPTVARVQRMLAATKRDPEELLGHIPPAMGPATVRSVAIHALMAGCKPEYLPLLLGAIPLLLRKELNLNGVQGTMGPVAPLMIVNGPYAKQIGLHGGNGCFGPGFRANASIGRAIRLILFNLGGAMPGGASATVFASPLRYSACLTEHVDASPWETLAVSRGYASTDNVITCAMVEAPHVCHDDVSEEPNRLLIGIADSMHSMGSFNIVMSNSDMVVAMSPEHAGICARAGMTRADVHQKLAGLAGRKLRDLKGGGQWRRGRGAQCGYDVDNDEIFVHAIKKPEYLQLIVAGGNGPQTAVCYGWGGGSFAVHGKYDI